MRFEPQVALDAAREEARGKRKIGTTSRGIGPAYEAKAARSALRTGDLLASDLEDRLAVLCEQVGPQLAALGGEAPDPAALADACRAWGERLADLLVSATQTQP